MAGKNRDADHSSTVAQPAPVEREKFRRRLSAAPLHHVPALDGLRAIAVAAVMLYHARFGWITGGFLGVSAFFTLSGFLITSLLLREWTNEVKIDLRAFWGRRFRRLLPASWATMALILVIGAWGGWNGDQLRALRGDVPFSLLEIVNWHFIWQDRSYGAGFVAPSPMEHFWSLAVEEQFYVILPVLVIGVLVLGQQRVPRFKLRRLMIVLTALTTVGLVLSGVLSRSVSTDRAYFGTDTRMAEMLIGSLLACFTLRQLRLEGAWLRRVAAWAGLLGLAVSVVLWNVAQVSSTWMYPWGFLLCALCTAAVILGALQEGLLSRALSVPPLLWLGKISYGVYLIHWPVFLLLTPARLGWDPWPLFALRGAVTLGCATVMFHLVEDPIRRRRRLQSPRLAMVGCASVAVLLASMVVVTRAPAPTSAIQRAADTSGTTTTIPVPPIKVMVLGDQYAESLRGAMADVTGMPVAASVSNDCGLATGGWVQMPTGPAEQDVSRCRDAVSKWSADIAAQQPDVVLVAATRRDASARRLDGDSPWTVPGEPAFSEVVSSMLNESLDELAAVAAKFSSQVVVMSSPPLTLADPAPLPPRTPDPDPLKEVLKSQQEIHISKSQPALPDQATLNLRLVQVNDLMKKAAESRSLRFLDVASMLTYLSGGQIQVDPHLGAAAIDTQVGTQLGGWVLSEMRGRITQAPTAPTATRSPESIALPEAPAPRPRRHTAPGSRAVILGVGDSVSMSLTSGLTGWGRRHRADVMDGSRLGCPVARGGMYKFQRDTIKFGSECEWADEFPRLINAYRPNVVMLSSGIWEVVDRQLAGDDRYRNISDPMVSRYVLAEFLTAVDVLGSDGATVAVITQPQMNSGLDQGFTGLPESDPARIDILNGILRQVVEMRPEVARLIDLQGWLRSQPGGESDPAKRPDGIHFTDDAASVVARWLGPQLVALARGH